MTPLLRLPVLLLLLSAIAVFAGCARKKPVLVVVPKEQPPIAAPTPTPTPEARTEPQAPASPTPTPQPSANNEEASKTTEKAQPKSRSRHHGSIRKPSPVVKAEAAPPDLKPEPRSTPAPISPSISPIDAKRDQSSTEQLLQATENTLNGIKRQLSKEEEGIVAQVRNYINQSRQASKDNDPARAHLLATKANQLSNELVRR
jgi:hypothetical protein